MKYTSFHFYNTINRSLAIASEKNEFLKNFVLFRSLRGRVSSDFGIALQEVFDPAGEDKGKRAQR